MHDDFVCELPSHFQADTPDYLHHLAVLLGNGKMSNRCTARLPKIMEALRSNPNLEISELLMSGCTARQAALIYAAIALGRAMNATPYKIGERFTNSRDVYTRYRGRFMNCMRENFIALSLDSKNRVIQERCVAIGSLSTSVVHPREVMGPLVRDSAAAFICMHNHPSGDPAPSREDRDCTVRLQKAGKILGINLLDHVVIGHDSYFSFADAGILSQPDVDAQS